MVELETKKVVKSPDMKVIFNETQEIDNVRLSFIISKNTEEDKKQEMLGTLYIISPKYIEDIKTVSSKKFKFKNCEIVELSSGNVEPGFVYTLTFNEILILSQD